MARIQSTWPYRYGAIALTGLGLAISVCGYLAMSNSARSNSTRATAPTATPTSKESIRSLIQAELVGFVTALNQSDATLQEASKRPSELP